MSETAEADSSSEESGETVTVKVWTTRGLQAFPDTDREPDEKTEIGIVPQGYCGSNPTQVDPHHLLEDEVEEESGYRFVVECDQPVSLNVHENDHYHRTTEWGRPIEQGLTYEADSNYDPFKCHLYGRVAFCVTPQDISTLLS